VGNNHQDCLLRRCSSSSSEQPHPPLVIEMPVGSSHNKAAPGDQTRAPRAHAAFRRPKVLPVDDQDGRRGHLLDERARSRRDFAPFSFGAETSVGAGHSRSPALRQQAVVLKMKPISLS